ncbi:MAG: biopolymer transporter ExbD [Candidatus Gastranaerophilales bacterium]|nr:biopolymer transporter ExbD [Candidatus Gastranaerophilales bacterium]
MAIGSSKDGIFNEINITPLTDIFLVLLIIMMVMAPMFQSMNNDIKIPEINSGISVENDKAVVSVTKSAEFFLNGSRINSENLTDELIKVLEQTTEKVIVVKADTNVKNKEIMKIMRAAQSAGYEKLTVAGEPLSKKQQQELESKADSQSIIDTQTDIQAKTPADIIE